MNTQIKYREVTDADILRDELLKIEKIIPKEFYPNLTLPGKVMSLVQCLEAEENKAKSFEREVSVFREQNRIAKAFDESLANVSTEERKVVSDSLWEAEIKIAVDKEFPQYPNGKTGMQDLNYGKKRKAFVKGVKSDVAKRYWQSPAPVTDEGEEEWLLKYCDNYKPGDFTWGQVIDILKHWQSLRTQQPIDDSGEETPNAWCGKCGAKMQIVRPGKHQCPNCE